MKKLIIPAVVLIGLLSSCAQSNSKESDVISEKLVTADAAKRKPESELTLDSSRQYLQTAYLKMQVKKLQETKETIRQIIRQQKGFVLSSELQNNIYNEKTVAINRDSAMKVTELSVGNTYSTKIPTKNLDSTIFLLEKLGVHIDNSSQNAEDVTMQFLQYANNSNDSTIRDLKRVQASNNAGIDKVMTIHELRKQQRDATLENQELAYNIRYSDLKLDIYQNPLIQTLVIANTDQYTHYKTPFGYELKNAFSQGVELFQTIIIMIAHLWLVILFVVALFFLWKIYRKRRQVVKI
ncbi:MAG TPA: DUF4349 domain-containing protein [Arachidicoccus sp.]